MKKVIRLTESDIHKIVKNSVKRILKEKQDDFEPAKYQGKWSVYDKKSRTFSNIGVGKKKAHSKAQELNDYCAKKDKEENGINESFEDDFNSTRDNFMNRRSPNGMFGFEMKNSEGEWEYGDVTYDPNSNTMSCMGVSIEVDSEMSVDANLEALYDELINNGYGDSDE